MRTHAVLITHEHVDHVVADRLRAAVQRNPELRIWSTRTVAESLTGAHRMSARMRAMILEAETNVCPSWHSQRVVMRHGCRRSAPERTAVAGWPSGLQWQA